MDPLSLAAGLALAVVPGVIVPVLVVRALVPALGHGPGLVRPGVRNPVPAGLGVVWLVWALGLLATQTFLDVAYTLTSRLPAEGGLLEQLLATPLTLPLYALPFTLVVGATALGLLEDAFGPGSPARDRAASVPAVAGGALGRVRRGGTIVLGVFYGAAIATSVVERSAIAEAGISENGALVLAWLCGALVIAFAADLGVRLDTVPGRTLKLYGLSVPVPAALVALSAVDAYAAEMAAYAGETGLALFATADKVALVGATLIVVVGPLVAAWRPELGGRAGLGSAGANTMGAVVGYLLAMSLSLAGLVVTAVVLGVLDLVAAGGRADRLFEQTPPLAWFDRLGRMPGTAAVGSRHR